MEDTVDHMQQVYQLVDSVYSTLSMLKEMEKNNPEYKHLLRKMQNKVLHKLKID